MKSKTLLAIFLMSFSLTSFAAIDSGTYVKKCMELASVDNRSSDELSCTAKTSKDADLLSSVGIDETFIVTAKKAKVGTWGDGKKTYLGEVAFVLKSGFFGLGAKVLRLNCIEDFKGKIVLRSNDLRVDIKEQIDSRVTASVICR